MKYLTTEFKSYHVSMDDSKQIDADILFNNSEKSSDLFMIFSYIFKRLDYISKNANKSLERITPRVPIKGFEQLTIYDLPMCNFWITFRKYMYIVLFTIYQPVFHHGLNQELVRVFEIKPSNMTNHYFYKIRDELGYSIPQIVSKELYSVLKHCGKEGLISRPDALSCIKNYIEKNELVKGGILTLDHNLETIFPQGAIYKNYLLEEYISPHFPKLKPVFDLNNNFFTDLKYKSPDDLNYIPRFYTYIKYFKQIEENTILDTIVEEMRRCICTNTIQYTCLAIEREALDKNIVEILDLKTDSSHPILYHFDNTGKITGKYNGRYDTKSILSTITSLGCV